MSPRQPTNGTGFMQSATCAQDAVNFIPHRRCRIKRPHERAFTSLFGISKRRHVASEPAAAATTAALDPRQESGICSQTVFRLFFLGKLSTQLNASTQRDTPNHGAHPLSLFFRTPFVFAARDTHTYTRIHIATLRHRDDLIRCRRFKCFIYPASLKMNQPETGIKSTRARSGCFQIRNAGCKTMMVE